MTPLSDFAPRVGLLPCFSAMARQSHSCVSMWLAAAAAVTALCASGCLLSDPPEYDEREQTVPVLDALTAVPAPTQTHLRNKGDTVSITVDFHSEDRGERVFALLFLNFAVEGQSYEWGAEYPPSTFDEKRTISTSWTVPGPEELYGCNQLSLVVTHESNVNWFTRPPGLHHDEGADLLTWWMDINDSGETLSECPSSSDPGDGSGP